MCKDSSSTSKGCEHSLADHDPSIIQDGNDFYLTSKEWAQTDEAREIHNRAKEFVELLENVAYIQSKNTSPITIGGVVRIDDDGRKHQILIAAHGALRVTLQPVRLRATGTVGGRRNRWVK